DMDKIWPTYNLKYLENGREKTMELAMTFADFAVTEARFRKHFRKVPRDAWNDNMVQLADFLEMDADEREGKFPFIWAVDRKQHLSRVLVAKPIVESCEERRDFWIMLRALAGAEKTVVEEVDVESKVRAEVVGRITQGLMKLAGGNGEGIADFVVGETVAKTTPVAVAEAPSNNGNGDYMAPWLETDECTA
ncbi:MAG: hypothetical protein KDD09_26805, partial [Phaeodactylibacter sp.]|nr:hypothetical protein [Phaeodactylibacter sp.]